MQVTLVIHQLRNIYAKSSTKKILRIGLTLKGGGTEIQITIKTYLS